MLFFFPGSPRRSSGAISLVEKRNLGEIGEKLEGRSSHQIVVSETTLKIEYEVTTGKIDAKEYVWRQLTQSGADTNKDNDFVDNGFIAYNQGRNSVSRLTRLQFRLRKKKAKIL